MNSICTFRLDDITPDMKWDNFWRVKALFDKYELKPLLGVVPDAEDTLIHFEDKREDFWQQIQKLSQEGWMIAQHGFRHVYETSKRGILGLNPFSEFAGLPFEVQSNKLREGKRILQENGIQTGIFMAPGHTYDKNTLQALIANGFTTITDGYAEVPYSWGKLNFYPCRGGEYKIPAKVNTICLHANVMQDADYIKLEQFIKANKDSIVSFSELLDGYQPVPRNLSIAIRERKNLWVYRIKGAIGHSIIFQQYLSRVTCRNKIGSALLRIAGLPYLILLGIKKLIGKKTNE